jgi:hypothetical protein
MIEHVKRFSFDIGPDGFDEEHGHGMPVFTGPTESVRLSSKDVILREIDAVQEGLDALRAAAGEL